MMSISTTILPCLTAVSTSRGILTIISAYISKEAEKRSSALFHLQKALEYFFKKRITKGGVAPCRKAMTELSTGKPVKPDKKTKQEAKYPTSEMSIKNGFLS